jgi:hypothetical protein
MWWLVGRQCILGDVCKFGFDAFFDGLPMKLMKEVCGGAVWMAPEDYVGNTMLDLLQFSKVGFRDTKENSYQEGGLNKDNCNCFGSVVCEGVADVTKCTDMIKGGIWCIRAPISINNFSTVHAISAQIR